MHVLIVNQYGLPAGMPGITRHGDLGVELVKAGHRVTVLASRFNYLTRSKADEEALAATDAEVTFRWLETGMYAGNDRRRMRSIVAFTARAAWEGIRIKPGPDIVIASSPHLLAGLVGVAVARRHRVPFVFEVRDLWPSALVDLGAVAEGSVAHRVLVQLERLCYRLADRVITVPPHADRRVAELGIEPSKCVHIPNATTLHQQRPRTLPRSIERLVEAAGERDLLVYTGAQGISNGLGTLILAVERLRETERASYERLAVLVIGDGGEHNTLVEEVRTRQLENVYFHPPIEKAAIPTVLERADFLLVSFADAPVYAYGLSPNKLFDYLAAARPVLLASRLSDTPVDEAAAGRRFEPGSATSLADAIVALMRTTRHERRAMGERGRQLVEQRYTVAATAAQLQSVLNEVVAARR